MLQKCRLLAISISLTKVHVTSTILANFELSKVHKNRTSITQFRGICYNHKIQKLSIGLDRLFLPILYKTLKISKGSFFPFTLIDGNFLMAKFFVRKALVVALIRMSALNFLVNP